MSDIFNSHLYLVAQQALFVEHKPKCDRIVRFGEARVRQWCLFVLALRHYAAQ